MHFDVGWMASKNWREFSWDGVSEYLYQYGSRRFLSRTKKKRIVIVPPLEAAIQSPNFDASLRLVNAASASSGGVA